MRERIVENNAMANILIIDDDKKTCDALSFAIRGLGHRPTCVYTLKDGIREALSNPVDVIFLDVRMPDGNGLEVLPLIRDSHNSPEIIIITPMGNPDGAELAIRSGAWGYIEKPPTLKEIMLPLARSLQYREVKRQGERSSLALKRDRIVGSSPRIMVCLDHVAQAATSEANVLIQGEAGTGKELFARAIHENSLRHDRNFVAVDCSALSGAPADSAQSGQERKAVIVAERPFEDSLQQAEGGTLFLDKIEELSPGMQKSFLKALQERRFRPGGYRHEVKSNFRLITAARRNLDQMVQNGEFRDDLLFRLRTVTIELPSLRERPEDIKKLAVYFVMVICEQYGMEIKGFSPDFFDVLLTYNWPGNVRELRSTLEGVVLTSARYDAILFPNLLPNHIRIQAPLTSPEKSASEEVCSPGDLGSCQNFPSMTDFVDEMKLQYLHNLIARSGRNVDEACRISGMSRSSFYDHVKKYKLNVPK